MIATEKRRRVERMAKLGNTLLFLKFSIEHINIHILAFIASEIKSFTLKNSKVFFDLLISDLTRKNDKKMSIGIQHYSFLEKI